MASVVVLGARLLAAAARARKLVEEAPAPGFDRRQRQRIHRPRTTSAPGRLPERGHGGFCSRRSVAIVLEVNTRLRVEHPVTRQTTSLDLVLEQLRVTGSARCPSPRRPRHWCRAFEFRINAEDVGRGFCHAGPVCARLMRPAAPACAVNSGVQAGSIVPACTSRLALCPVAHRHPAARCERALARARTRAWPVSDRWRGQRLPFHRAVIGLADFT